MSQSARRGTTSEVNCNPQQVQRVNQYHTDVVPTMNVRLKSISRQGQTTSMLVFLCTKWLPHLLKSLAIDMWMAVGILDCQMS